jgi:CheY-like chemotaxis protein
MVLLDSWMPGMSGEEFLAQVALDAELEARIRVVCFSGGAPIATPPAIVVAVLAKPSRIAELVEALEKGARELG